MGELRPLAGQFFRELGNDLLGLAVGRVNVEVAFPGLQCRILAAALGEDAGKAGDCAEMARLEFQDFLDVRDGLLVIAHGEMQRRALVPGADKIIIQQLLNCGLDWDEEIEYQSKRSHIYESALTQLLQEKKAYGCRCTRKQIEDQLLRLGKKKDRHGELVYPGSCRNLKEVTEPCAWRLLVTDPEIESSVGDFV